MEKSEKLVGENIKRIREGKGLTQKDVYEKTGVTTKAQSEIETGKREPRRSTLRLLATAMGCTVDDFKMLRELSPGARADAELKTFRGPTSEEIAAEVKRVLAPEFAAKGKLGGEEEELLAIFRNDEKRRRAILIAAGLWEPPPLATDQSKVKSRR